jgi:transcriptional regulator with XRE-family HTH domain
MEFRKETFELVFHFFKCLDSGQEFTDTFCDRVNLNQLYNQYRFKLKIPFIEQVIKTREKYELSASKMSAILGFGINSYRQYEAGEIPSISNARLIQLVEDPKKFIQMVELSHQLDQKTKKKYILKAESLLEDQKVNRFKINLKEYLLGDFKTDVFTGYRVPNFEKITEMVVYFTESVQPFKTKMNKLLFYSDFVMFKNTGFSISGLKYLAEEMGPVPINFQSLFEYLENTGEILMETTEVLQGYTGEQFKPRPERVFKSEMFSTEELEVMKNVATVFKFTSNHDIIGLSKLEEAWRLSKKKLISYQHAFVLHNLQSQK